MQSTAHSCLAQVLHFDLMKSGIFSVLPWMTMAVTSNVGGWIADTLVTRGFSVTRVRKIMQTVRFATAEQRQPKRGAAGRCRSAFLQVSRCLLGMLRSRPSSDTCLCGAQLVTCAPWDDYSHIRPPAGAIPGTTSS